MDLTPEHCRAARGLLDWTQEELAERAGLSRSTVRDFETARHHLNRASEQQVIEAFVGAGVELLGIEDGPLGVRLLGGRRACPGADRFPADRGERRVVEADIVPSPDNQ